MNIQYYRDLISNWEKFSFPDPLDAHPVILKNHLVVVNHPNIAYSIIVKDFSLLVPIFNWEKSPFLK